MGVCTMPTTADDVLGDGRWMSMHNRYVSQAQSTEPEVVFIGDSIIQGLQFSTLWNEKLTSLHCINFGIGGDKVQHVLWRLLNGELDFNTKIKAVLLFVGTNNLEDPPEDVFAGIEACVDVIRTKLGPVPVILPTLLPRGQHPNRLRIKNNAVNQLLIDKYQNKTASADIHVVQIHASVLQSDETISHYLMYDYLHLTDTGYTKVFTPVYEKLQEVVKK